ncbi:hypothetical protein, partial [Marinagarivorans algicola]|uniref:hypothetical protein n=1 Tax=Marinagarivorans algicola TaxID=1513270 RepID=UPI000A8C35C2
ERTISHTVNTPLITVDVIAGDDIISALEDDNDVTISGTTANVEEDQTVTVVLNGTTYTAQVNSDSWSITVPAADAQALMASHILTADVFNTAGDAAPQATRTVAHTVDLPSVTLSAISTDDVISASEDDSDITLSGTTANVEDGQTVTVTVNGKTYSATVNNNTWSTLLPAADAQALGASESVTVNVSNVAGDAAIQAERTISHTVNTPLITVDVIAGDDIISALEDDNDVTISGTTANVEE